MTLDLVLTREAKASGGDRYEVELLAEEKPWVVYVPQSISRKNGSRRRTISVEEIPVPSAPFWL